MSALGSKLRLAQGNNVLFWCPGCDGAHAVVVGVGAGPRWTFNGDGDRPTFGPSIRVSGRVPPTVCHSFVTDGRIAFCADSTHALSGQTVDLPNWPLPEWRDGNP